MSTKLAKIIADFRTSLATEIAVGGTSATLQNATDDDGVALPAGKYFFTLDGNNSVKEHIVCDLSGTSLTNIKSVSRQGVQTAGVVRKHRVGATVVITDFAHIRYINDLLDGTTDLNGASPLAYDAEPSFTYGQHELVTWDKSKDYTDSVAVSGAPNADTTTKGIVEIATGAELAAGTGTGGTGAAVVPAGSSFKNSSAGAGDANKVPVLNASGVLDTSFIPNPLSRTADQLQITTDPDSANDPIRKSYLDARIIALECGDGSDGVLNVTSGTTTLTADKVYQYSSINISVGATLTIGGAAAGKILRILCQGNCTNAGTIDLAGQGKAGGAGAGTGGATGGAGTAGYGVGGAGAGGGGGEGQNAATGSGNNGSAASGSTGGAGGTGAGGVAGDGGAGANAASFNSIAIGDSVKFGVFVVALGAGGGGGGGGRDSGNNNQSGQNGGAGGGALILEVGGDMTISGTINANGITPSTGGTSRAGGGGGGGGSVLATCKGTYTGGGTINTAAGSGSAGTGSGGFFAGNGGNGSAGSSLVGQNVIVK